MKATVSAPPMLRAGYALVPGNLCTFLKALSDADVDLDLVDISETSVGAVTHADRLGDAERAVRRALAWPRPARNRWLGMRATSCPLLAPRSRRGLGFLARI